MMNIKIVLTSLLLTLPNLIFCQNGDSEVSGNKTTCEYKDLDPNAFVLLDKEPVPLNLDEVRASIAYPASFNGNQIKARVTLRILIDNKGNFVKHIVLKSPDKELTKAVTTHIDRLKFSPAIKDHKPTHAWMTIPFDFVPRKMEERAETNIASPEGQPIELDSYPFAKNFQEIIDRIGYPIAARNKKIEGSCEVRVLVGNNGKYLEHVVVGNPHPIFKDAVLKQVPYLEFEPAMLDGHPIRCWVTIPFHFNL